MPEEDVAVPIDVAFQFFAFESRPALYLLSMWHLALFTLLAPPRLTPEMLLFPHVVAAATLASFLLTMGFEAPSNVWNAVNDVAEDAVNKPYQFIASGAYPPGLAEKMAFAFWLITGLYAAWLSLSTSPLVLLLYLYAVAASFLYSDNKYTGAKLKGRHVFAALAIGSGFTALFAAGWFLVRPDWDAVLALLAAHVFLLYAGLAVLKDFRDVEGDRAAGLRTLPVVNYRLAVALYYVLTLTSALPLLPIPLLRGFNPAAATLWLAAAAASWIAVAKWRIREGMKAFLYLKIVLPVLLAEAAMLSAL